MNILVDTGFLYALFDESDPYHNKVIERGMVDFLEFGNIVLPHPILYETLNTRFVKRKEWCNIFNTYLSKGSTVLVSDEVYKEKALSITMQNAISGRRPMSLVDAVIRLMLDDVNLNISALITFNVEDFVDVCMQKKIELISDK
jgi:hypothetical protein